MTRRSESGLTSFSIGCKQRCDLLFCTSRNVLITAGIVYFCDHCTRGGTKNVLDWAETTSGDNEMRLSKDEIKQIELILGDSTYYSESNLYEAAAKTCAIRLLANGLSFRYHHLSFPPSLIHF